MTDRFIQIVDIDDEVINFRTIKKTVHENGEWVVKTFYELKDVPIRVTSLWLIEHYGDAQYVKTWWGTHTSVVMSDKIYTHWKLSQ